MSCALLCNPNDSTNECGAGTCQPIQGKGICTYGASPGPAPGPSPGCKDEDSFLCKDMIRRDSMSKACTMFSLICKKSCGCCGSSPKPWCDNEVTLRIDDANSIVV